MNRGGMNASVAGFLWLMLVGLSAVVSPPVRPDVWEWMARVMAGDWTGENPLVLAHFNLMGLWPLVMAMLLVDELRPEEGVPAWPFVVASAMMGAFALLPWFGLRTVPAKTGPRYRLEGLLTSVGAVAGVGLLTLGFAMWGLLLGDVYGWEMARAQEGFMYIMTLDFGVLWLVSLLIAREQGEPAGDIRWRFAGLPLVGALVWVWIRERDGVGAPGC